MNKIEKIITKHSKTILNKDNNPLNYIKQKTTNTIKKKHWPLERGRKNTCKGPTEKNI